MRTKINFKITSFYFVTIFFIFSCMDPVIDTDDSYSDYIEVDASEYLNDPDDGFLNSNLLRSLCIKISTAFLFTTSFSNYVLNLRKSALVPKTKTMKNKICHFVKDLRSSGVKMPRIN